MEKAALSLSLSLSEEVDMPPLLSWKMTVPFPHAKTNDGQTKMCEMLAGNRDNDKISS